MLYFPDWLGFNGGMVLTAYLVSILPRLFRSASALPLASTLGWALVVKILARLHTLGGDATNDQAKTVFGDLVEPLLDLSKCPDFVVNRGHLFGTDLPNDDKAALIEFLKTF